LYQLSYLLAVWWTLSVTGRCSSRNWI